jgi:hypothetical protein
MSGRSRHCPPQWSRLQGTNEEGRPGKGDRPYRAVGLLRCALCKLPLSCLHTPHAEYLQLLLPTNCSLIYLQGTMHPLRQRIV